MFEIYYKNKKVNGCDDKEVLSNLLCLYEQEKTYCVRTILGNTEIHGMSVLSQRQYFYFLLGALGGIANNKGINIMSQVSEFY